LEREGELKTDLLSDSLLSLEEGVETSRLDGLEERCSDVHVSVEGMFTSGQLREESDGGLEVSGV
jgi:hypothetical protein